MNFPERTTDPRNMFAFGQFRLDGARRLLTRRDGTAVPLTPRAFDILHFLVRNAGELIEKAALMRAVWDHIVVEENNLNQHISALRRRLGERPDDHRYIVTVPGRGYRFVADVTIVGALEPQPGRAGPRTLAVLPFSPLVPTSRNEALEFGIADSLILRLSSSREIVVRALSAVRGVQALNDPVRAGLQLGVDLVIDGSLQVAEDRVRVTARLLELPLGRQLWMGTFDEPFTDIFALQDSIASKVATALALHPTREERSRLLRHDTESAEAFRLCMVGRFHMDTPGEQSLQRAIEYFEQALAIDPQYALAYAGLSDCYTVLAVFGAPPQAVFPKARDAASKALALDSQLAEPYMALGHYQVQYDRDWLGGEQLYRRAIAVNPSCAIAHHRYSILLMTMSREQESFAEIDRAYELDPASLLFHATAGFLAFWARRYEEAIEQLRLTVEMQPQFWMPHYWLCQVLVQTRAYELAMAHADTACRLTEGRGTSWLTACVHGHAGRHEEARVIIEQLISRSASEYIAPYDVAQAWAAVRDADRTFEFLERAYADRSRGMDNMNVNPAFDPFRADPRWHSLVDRMGLGS